MPDPVRLTIATHELEAELICGLLRNAEIQCVHRITNMGFGSGGEMPSSGAGAREILVRSEDLEQARAVIAEAIDAATEADSQ